MADDTMQEDERSIELSSIAAIFPELILDPTNPYTASIDLPVVPSTPVSAVFPESADGAPPPSNPDQKTAVAATGREIHHLSHLPFLHLQIDLPEGYPATLPPKFALSTSPHWLSSNILERLQQDGERLWEEFGHDQVLFAYIDHLQQSAENAFGTVDEHEFLEIPLDHKIALLDFDIKAKREAFEKETFDCGVCLDPKKGTVCHRMVDCGHVFCVQCLQEFYNNAIKEGDITSVRCLAPDCAKKRNDEVSLSGKRRKPKTQLSPSELLQIPLDHTVVKRYVTMKHKAELESDKNTIYCPRKWCQGAARSKKHKKPTNWEDAESSDDEREDETNSDTKDKTFSRADRLCICEDCSFAFCSRCFQGWHGELTICIPRSSTGELTEEDKASLEYLKLHTTLCPTCEAPCQKTHGCNHMICFRCNTHFCYLCSAWLDSSNPYKHFNMDKTSCYMRLWELEGGDGDDVGQGYAGGNGPPHEHPQDIIIEIPLEEEPEAALPLIEAAPAQPVVLEGPRVMRIAIDRPLRPDPGQRELEPAQVRFEHGRGREVHRHPQPGNHPGAGFVQRQPGRRHAAAVAARRAAQPQRAPRRPNPGHAAALEPHAGAEAERAVGQEEANRAWVQNFVQMALNDQEDLLEWNSDDEDDVEAWQIPVR